MMPVTESNGELMDSGLRLKILSLVVRTLFPRNVVTSVPLLIIGLCLVPTKTVEDPTPVNRLVLNRRRALLANGRTR